MTVIKTPCLYMHKFFYNNLTLACCAPATGNLKSVKLGEYFLQRFSANMMSTYLHRLFLIGLLVISIAARRIRFENDPCTGSWREIGAYCLEHDGKYVYEDVVDKACIKNDGYTFTDVDGTQRTHVICIREGHGFGTKEECENKCIKNYS